MDSRPNPSPRTPALDHAAERPLVSVVVLTYDRPGLLAACLASLRRQDVDGQVEIVVADDGSGPETAEVVRVAAAADPRIRHVRHEHRGIPAARNLGVGEARGCFVAIVADDYVLAPDYLSTALAYLEAHPEAAVVRSDILPLEDSFGARLSHCFYGASVRRQLEREGLSLVDTAEGRPTRTLDASGAAVFRAEVLEEVGEWDERLQRGEDTDHTERLRRLGHEVHILTAGTVRQHYRAVPTDTLYKCFVTGIYRARLGPAHGPRAAGKARDLFRALERARLAGDSWLVRLGYLPWMVLFEIAIYSGVLIGRTQVWVGRRRRGTRRSRIPERSVR